MRDEGTQTRPAGRDAAGTGRDGRRSSRSAARAFLPTLARYACAVAAALAATIVQRLLWPYIPYSPHLVFYPAIVLVSRFASLGRALLCTGLSLLATAYYFLRPYARASTERSGDALDLVILGAMTGTLAALVRRVLAARRLAVTDSLCRQEIAR